jgi:hypothetical protein
MGTIHKSEMFFEGLVVTKSSLGQGPKLLAEIDPGSRKAAEQMADGWGLSIIQWASSPRV